MNLRRSILAGLAATAAMTMLMLGAPLMGVPNMLIGDMLGAFLHIGSAAGWGMHLIIGLVLASIYATWFAARLPGGPVVRGLVYGLGVFVMAQVLVSPMMGGGVFSGGNVPMISGSLLGHLVYGALVGGLYGDPHRAAGLASA